jgi:flagellin
LKMAAITINTNLASLTAQRNLTAATTGMNRAMERLTTGFRINSGKDDAAGSAVSNLMEAQISAYDVAESNTTMGLSLLDTAEGILGIVGSYIQRIRDLTEQAANGTYGTASLQAIRTEVQQRMLEINRLCSVIDFNGIKLLDGTSAPAMTGSGINLQVGNNTGSENVINLDYTLFLSAKITALLISGNANSKTGYGNPTNTNWAERNDEKKSGITGALLARLTNGEADYGNTHYNYKDTNKYFNILAKKYDPNNMGEAKTGINSCITAICDAVYTDDATARDFLCFLDDAIDNISARTALIGAYMNRVESAVDAISVQKENIVSANSSIKDADVATESSSYIKYQILQQSSATLLSTANQTPQIALNLI